MDFISFSEVEPAESVTSLIFGPSKSGKTDFSGSAGERSIYLDVGRGAETFHSQSYIQRRGPYKGFYFPIGEKGGGTNYIVPTKAQAYDQVCDIIDESIKKIPEKFDTFILDELTAFSRFALNKGIEINGGTGKSQAKATSDKWDMIVPGVQDYGAEMSLVKQFLAGTIDICKANNKHLIVLAHERYLYDVIVDTKSGKKTETDTIKKILPSFTGRKDVDAIPNLFDCVLHTEVVRSGENLIYRIRTMGDETLVAGTRYGGVFKPVETGLTFPDMIRRIKEGAGVVTK